ncbi:hypothetical protein SLS56_003610 [Neofusicoccum ribis]|uniref:Uncharacterized protein n=1 Tax=Neofusicoccum ribis TaxID=45134 RepID=A0ABR3SZJ9_9PEZI
MDSQDQHNQPGPGYHDLPPGQETPADQQPDAVQSKAEQQQQDLPQPQPHLQTNQPYPPYAFGFPPQPQQQQPTGAANQDQNYGMPPHFQHMSYGGYNFPPPPSQYAYPIASAAPHLRDGSQPPESQPEQLQHDQEQQFQPGASQDFQQNLPQQFQQVPDSQQGQPQQFLQGAPQQVQHGNHQYGAPHYPGFPPQQYPYWGHPGQMPGYPPQFFSGPMMQSNSHEPTPEPTLKASTPHRGHSDSPAAPPDQAVQQHGTYPMPPMMGGFPYPGPAHPYYNHPAPSMPPAVPPAAQPTPEPPKPTQENVAAPPLPGSAPLDPALDAASTPAAGLVSVQLPPDVLQQLLGNPQVLAALRESGYAGDERALGGAEAAAPRTPLGQEQRSSPSGGQQDSSPQDERTIGSDGPMTLAQLAAVRREGEGEKEG